MRIQENNFFLPSDYRISSQINVTASQNEQYWSPANIRMSSFYQYHVYLRAKSLIIENGLQSAVDIGCGPALKLEKLIAPVCRDVVGLDHPNIIERCKQRFGFAKFIQFIPYDIEKDAIPLNRTFDLVICVDVIEHLINPGQLLDAIRSVSNDRTFIILFTPDRDTLRGKVCLHSPNAAHIREWSMEEFSCYVSSRGLSILEHRLVPQMKLNLTREYFRETTRQLLSLRSPFSCQMVICKKRI